MLRTHLCPSSGLDPGLSETEVHFDANLTSTGFVVRGRVSSHLYNIWLCKERRRNKRIWLQSPCLSSLLPLRLPLEVPSLWRSGTRLYKMTFRPAYHAQDLSAPEPRPISAG